MCFYVNLNLSKDKDDISKEILKCALSRKKRIDVLSVFYNSSDIFLQTIIAYANQKKSILYITNEKEDSIDIINFINEFTNFHKYRYISTNTICDGDECLYICNYDNALKLGEKFDLVIYNDIRSFPKYDKQQIKKALLKMCKAEGEAIAYSVESIFNEDVEITLPLRDNETPIIEPRIITTRININVDIPLVVYEYLNWSIISNRKVIIYVPDEEKAISVFEYLSNFKEKLSKNIFLFLSKKSHMDIPIKFMNNNKGIIITNDFEESHLEFQAVDVMVYFADSIKFNYKHLLYLSSKVGRDKDIQRGEVIFLANVETEHMEKAKDICRKFNKKAWDQGFLSI